jgi:DNA-binding transcriptional MocR family regulator
MPAIAFARGVPAPECLAVAELADCARAAIERDGERVLSYGTGGGYGPLREWIGARHGVDPGCVLITNGSLQGFLFLARRLVTAERPRVLVEAPTYDRPLKLLAQMGASVTAIPQDDDGLDLDALERELRSGPPPAFLYAIPTFPNPSGRTLTLERRRRLVELTREHGLTVLEDDPYGLVRFDGEPLPTVRELEGGERVIYASSFSKTVAPGVRVGYFVFPDSGLASALETAANDTYISPVLLGQATVHEFIERGRFEPNLERVNGLLGARRDAMLAALESELGGSGATWSRPEGGYFVWLDLPDGVDAGALLERATQDGVTFVKGTDFFPGGADGRSSARLAYSYVSPAEIGEGVARLAALLPELAAA